MGLLPRPHRDAVLTYGGSPAAGLAVVFRKELADGLRERRAVASALVFGPLFGPALFAILTGYAVNLQMDQAESVIGIPVVGGSAAPNLMSHLRQRQIDVDHERFAGREALIAAVRDGAAQLGLVVDEAFGSSLRKGTPARVWVVSDSANNAARAPTARLRSALREYGNAIGTQRLVLRGVNPEVIRPVAVLAHDVATPSSRGILLLGMVTYFLLFATLLGGTQVAADATAGERERGSLEPLLTLGVPRYVLVWGKAGAAFVFMSVSLAVCIASFAVASRVLPLEQMGMTANLTPLVCITVFAIMLPFAVLGAGAMTAVASWARSFREAQTYTSIALVLPPLPIVLVVFNPMRPTVATMSVPGLSQHLLVTELVKGESIDPLLATVSAAVSVLVAIACVMAAVRRYGSERLLA